MVLVPSVVEVSHRASYPFTPVPDTNPAPAVVVDITFPFASTARSELINPFPSVSCEIVVVASVEVPVNVLFPAIV